ncbi:MAG: hypothetical protein M0R05_02510 [Bacilli bacterium]|nr:hypothetical protein [Bacilli bacterium]MDD4077061.1 hypothetical protein [Bacilli bacterium]MDD4387846.1 hypothetical protein [Bacilli bacterium]
MREVGENIKYNETKQELENVKDYFTEIYKEYEDLLKESKHIYRKYCFLFGEAYYQRYQSYLLCLRLKRKLELYQTYINRQEEINYQEAEAILDKEMFEHFDKLREILIDYVDASLYFRSKRLSGEETKELKRIYYKIAKRIHPDITGEFTEAQKDLWEKTLNAYQHNDLEVMRECEFLLENLVDVGRSPSTLDAMKAEINRFYKEIEGYKLKSQKIINSFPYNQSSLLFDEDYIENELNKLTAENIAYKEKAEEYLEILENMMPTSEKEIC